MFSSKGLVPVGAALVCLLGLPAMSYAGEEVVEEEEVYVSERERAADEQQGTPGFVGGLYFGSAALSTGLVDTTVNLTQFQETHPGQTLSVDAADQAVNFDLSAGVYIGYFPPFLTFDINESNALGLGLMTKGGFTFRGGFGAWLGGGPELGYRFKSLHIGVGHMFSFLLLNRNLGNLNLHGENYLVLRDREPDPQFNIEECSRAEFEGNGSQCVRHDSNSTLRMHSTATAQAPYMRIGYEFSKAPSSGIIGLTFGYRMASKPTTEFQLVGKHEKLGGSHETAMRGAEFDAINDHFDFSGFFVELELFSRPF